MKDIDLREFYSGGYFLIRSDTYQPQSQPRPLIPERVISLSNHVCPKRLSLFWGWGDRESAIAFGIPQDRMEDFKYWCNAAYLKTIDISMFYTVEDARNFVAQFLLNTTDLFLVGTVLPKQHQRIWVDDEEEDTGTAKRIKEGIPVELGGIPLGYEVVSYSYNDYRCSWLCSGLESDMNELFGIRPGPYGLLQAQSEAKAIYEWISEDGYWGERAEPEPYDYWLLMSYPLNTSAG